MEYKLLGNTGVNVSELCFGTMSFGDTADEAMSAAMYQACRDKGINFFDCANVYAGGRSEEILGKLIAHERDELVITSKVTSPTKGGGINSRGYSRRHIVMEVEKSLKRLGTDRIDVYFLHHFDPSVPIEDVVRTLDDLVKQGKILYPAISNWSAWQIALALGVSEYQNLSRIEVLQPMYSLVKRQAEVEILPLAKAKNIAVIPYSPLGGGLLTGKYGTNKKPDGGRIVDNKMYTKRYSENAYYQVAEDFTAHAQEKGYHPATLAVAWAMSHPDVTAPIIGARNTEQLADSLAALDVDMTPQWRAEISALSYTPPPAHDRLEEQIG
ncbi:MAG: aldo/keto reductase [Phototrophicaceae bacterium]